MTGTKGNIAENMYGFYKRLGELCAYDHGEVAGCRFVWNRKGSWPAFILGNPDFKSVSEADTAITEKLAPAFWIMEKSEGSAALELEKAGIRAIREWKGMELRADEFQSAFAGLKESFGSGTGSATESGSVHGSGPGSGSRIEILSNEPAFKGQWLKIVNTELLSGSQMGPELLDSISSSNQFRWMLAFRDGRPVGTGLSFSENGVCGLYMIATETSSRGKGIATRLSAELIAQALAAGDTHFVLHATPLGAPVYAKLGFREINTFSVLWKLGC